MGTLLIGLAPTGDEAAVRQPRRSATASRPARLRARLAAAGALWRIAFVLEGPAVRRDGPLGTR